MIVAHLSLNIDAEYLLCHVLQKNRAYLLAHPDLELSPHQKEYYEALLNRRKAGEPIAYLIGSRGFWKHDFIVTPDTLIPRPETELIIETTLELFDTKKPLRILDLGTGSGAIAISLALESHHWQVIATDQSEAAISIARKNARMLQAINVSFLKSNWFNSLQGTFDLIVSNPPYIAANDPHLHQGDLRFEPQTALASGKDGLDDLRIIISKAPQFLNPHGVLMVEHGYDQEQTVQSLFKRAEFNEVQTLKDLQSHPRITLSVKNKY